LREYRNEVVEPGASQKPTRGTIDRARDLLRWNRPELGGQPLLPVIQLGLGLRVELHGKVRFPTYEHPNVAVLTPPASTATPAACLRSGLVEFRVSVTLPESAYQSFFAVWISERRSLPKPGEVIQVVPVDARGEKVQSEWSMARVASVRTESEPPLIAAQWLG
jgi:hypothetical protein